MATNESNTTNPSGQSDKTYNGWSNYETWAAALWLENDEGIYKDLMREIRRALDASDIANYIKDLIEENTPDLGCTLYSDLLNAALSEIDWLEIAETYFKEANDDNE